MGVGNLVTVYLMLNVLSCNYGCLSEDNHIVESAAIKSSYISRSNEFQGHMYDFSTTQHVNNVLYCNFCGNMIIGKCEHCFNNGIEHTTEYSSTLLYDRHSFVTSFSFETRVDYTYHEYNCPINRITVYIVLLYRAGFQPRFAYLVKYWDFPNVLLLACNCLPPGVLSFIHTECLVIHWSHADGMEDSFVGNIIDKNNPKIVWQDYQKESFVKNTFCVTYEKYMEDIIDSLLEYNYSGVFSDEPKNLVHSLTSVPVYGREVQESVDTSIDVVNVDSTFLYNYSDSDINFSDKKLGYLTKQSTEFTFVGPDSQMVEITDIQQCVDIAQQIRCW